MQSSLRAAAGPRGGTHQSGRGRTCLARVFEDRLRCHGGRVPDESGQVLTFTLVNDNNALFSVQPDIDEATGALTYTPADDEHCWRYMITFRRTRPVREDEKKLESDIGPDYRKFRNLGNHYLQDREEQKKATFIGLGTSFLVHDSCATESMGPIYDRSKEHLGTSDKTVIAVRRFLLNAVKAFRKGAEPPHLVTRPEENAFHHIACIAVKIPSSKPAGEYIEEYIEERSRVPERSKEQRAEPDYRTTGQPDHG